jgi:hypothetical protein
MQWEATLNDAASRFNGGRRSFPPSSDATFARCTYDPPNPDYQKLFRHQATVSRSRRNKQAYPHSAGWLFPESSSICNPVFVAHSVLSAVWLLRNTLGDSALPDAAWGSLVHAACALTDAGIEEPLSAQVPPVSTDYGKRLAPSAPASTPKRARVDESPSPLSSSQHSPAPFALSLHSEPLTPPAHSPAHSPVNSPAYHTTITKNNRRAELQRDKKRVKVSERKRFELGLVAPPDSAAPGERNAYRSITPADEPTIAWIIKQPAGPSGKSDFYHTARSPYLRASEFLTKARSLGNPSSQAYASKFLQAWRKRGSLFAGAAERAAPSPQDQAVAFSARDDSNRVFCTAWERCNRYDDIIKSVHIEYRWAQALLGQAYSQKLAELQEKDPTPILNHTGRSVVRTEAINTLFALVHPDPANAHPKARDAFRSRLSIATRWYTIAQALGWGVFIVMSEECISHYWIGATIGAWGVPIFIDLVKRERPDVCAAAKAFEEWLGPEGIAGGPLGGKKRLGIELDTPPVTAEVYEVLDTDSEGEDDLAETQTQLVRKSPAVYQRSLRQTSLLDLFHTVE